MSGYGYGDDSGGFVQGGSQQQTQGGDKNYTRDSVRPATIKQILAADEVAIGPNSEFRIDGEAITQVTFVAQIRNFTPQATTEMFLLDDGTGVIDAKKFLSSTENTTDDSDPSGAGNPQFHPQDWVRVFGRVKSFSGKRSVNIHVVRPVETYNEVNYHLLEAAMVHLYFRKQAGGGGGAGHMGGGGDSMFVDSVGGMDSMSGGGGMDMGGKLANMSADVRKVWNAFMTIPRSNEGTRIEVVAAKVGLGVEDAMQAAMELSAIGALYNTMDEHTFDVMSY